MWIAAEPGGDDIGPPVVLIVLIIGGIIYTFGYLRAVMHRANSDYKKTKAGLPGMRKDFWRAWWAAVKVGFWVLVAAGILITWMVQDVRTT